MANKPFYGVGLHLGEVIQQGLTTAATTGTAQFLLRVKILGTPDNNGSYEPHRQQYERSIYMALTDKTMEYVVPNLEMLGFTGDSLQQLDPSHPEHQSFVGNQIDLWCKHETYNGKEQERWQLSNRQAIETKTLDTKQANQLDMLFGRAKRAACKSSPIAAITQKYAGRSTAPPENDTMITDDDIPF